MESLMTHDMRLHTKLHFNWESTMLTCNLAPLISIIFYHINGDLILIGEKFSQDFKMDDSSTYQFDLNSNEVNGKWSNKATIVFNLPSSANITQLLANLAKDSGVDNTYLGVYDQSNAIIFVVENTQAELTILNDPKAKKHPQLFIIKRCILTRPNPFSNVLLQMPLHHVKLEHLLDMPLKGYHLTLGGIPYGTDIVGTKDVSSKDPQDSDTTGLTVLYLMAIAESLGMGFGVITERYSTWGDPMEEG